MMLALVAIREAKVTGGSDSLLSKSISSGDSWTLSTSGLPPFDAARQNDWALVLDSLPLPTGTMIAANETRTGLLLENPAFF